MRDHEPRVGAFLRRYREEQGWTLRGAAKRVGIPHSRVSEVESQIDARLNKPFTPSYKLLLKFAKGYGIPAADLFDLAGYKVEIDLTADERAHIALLRGLSPASRQQVYDLAKLLSGGDGGSAGE